jgi:hypothetical protein
MDDVAALRALGFEAELIDIAPRGGVWGRTIQVPARQAERARRALHGDVVYATRAAEREARARARARHDAETNVLERFDVTLSADAGAVKIRADDLVPLSTALCECEGAHLLPVGWDGLVRLTLVTVRDAERRFSRHEAFGDQPPDLLAEARGAIRVYHYDCGQDFFIVNADSPVRFYVRHRRVYAVGTSFSIHGDPP